MSDIEEEVRNSLIVAVSRGETEKVEKLVSLHGLSYSPDFCEGYALVFNAALFGYQKIVKFLLEEGAKVDSGGGGVDTPLHFAAWFGDAELAQSLLDHKAQIDARDRQHETPLHVACKRGHENVVQLLLDRGANANALREPPIGSENKFARMRIGQAAYHTACERGHKGFKDIFYYGAEIDYHNNHELLLLESANDQMTYNWLLKSNVDQNIESEGNITPLHLATNVNCPKIVELLLKKSAGINAQTDKGLTPLLIAAKFRLTAVCKVLLERGACINSKDEDGKSALYYAADTSNLHLFNYILQRKPDDDSKVHELVFHMLAHYEKPWSMQGEIIDAFIKHGFTPNLEDVNSAGRLVAAVKSGHTKMVKCLLSHGANFNCMDRNLTALQYAVQMGDREMVELLLNSGCDVHAKSGKGETALFYSIELCMKLNDVEAAEIIQLLLDHGADLEEVPDLLHKAACKQYVEVCKTLIKNGANVNALDENGVTPLCRVALERHGAYDTRRRQWYRSFHTAEGEIDVVKLLIDNGADVTFKTKHGFTALHLSVLRRKIEIVRLLLAGGAGVDSRTKDDSTPLHLVSFQRYYRCMEVCEILLENGADVHALDGCGRPPLLLAVSQGDSSYSWITMLDNTIVDEGAEEKMAVLLLSFGANPHFQTEEGSTALHLAAQVRSKKRKVVSLLLDHGVDVNVCNADGVSPLHLACQHGNEEIVDVLLTNGANVTAVQNNCLTPLHLAASSGCEKVVKMLLKLDLDVNARGGSNETPLHCVCSSQHENEAIVNLLLNHRANVKAVQMDGLAPLHLAALKGHYSIVKTLLKLKVDVNARGASNETALHCACVSSRRSVEIIKTLLESGCDINVENDVGKTALGLAVSEAKPPEGFLHVPQEIQDCSTTLKHHVIKLIVAGFYVSKNNLSLLDDCSKLVDFEQECEEEIRRMKCQNLLNNLSLHSIFAKRRNPWHMSNVSIITMLDTFDFSEYPIYESLLLNTIRDSKERMKLLPLGKEILRILMKANNALNVKKLPIPPIEVLEEIVSLLSIRDLENLISCGEGLKRQLLKKF